jgi:vitamin B12 transporter
VDYRSTYRVNDQFAVTGGFRFQNERGSYVYPVFATNQQTTRANYDYTLQMQGSVHHRLFYTLGGAVQRNSLYGTQGEPQFGIGYYFVRPGRGWFEGTHLRANFSKGVQEPSLSTELSSLYLELQSLNDGADIAKFHVRPIDAQRSRSYEGGVDQNIYSDSVVLKLSYFHNTYDRGIEYVTTSQFNGYFHQNLPQALFGFYLNSLATLSEGIEAELQYQLMPRLFFRGGYTYLDSSVQQSFSSDALDALGGTPTINPRYPNTPIGVSSPLVGARPFRRAPHTGFATLSYSGVKWNAAAQYAMATKSDDSTFIDQYSNANFDNSMLLPNRNLAYGYNKLDAHVTYQWKPSFAVFVQGDNLLNEKHIGAFGYPSLPITFRAGLKIRFPAE